MNDEITPTNQNSNENGGIGGMFSLWLKALTQPSVETYQEIGFSASDSTSKDYGTIFIAAVIQFFISFIIGLTVQSITGYNLLDDLGGLELGPMLGGSLFGLICMVPFIGG